MDLGSLLAVLLFSLNRPFFQSYMEFPKVSKVDNNFGNPARVAGKIVDLHLAGQKGKTMILKTTGSRLSRLCSSRLAYFTKALPKDITNPNQELHRVPWYWRLT